MSNKRIPAIVVALAVSLVATSAVGAWASYLSEDFNSYPSGTWLTGAPGWVWNGKGSNNTPDIQVTNATAYSTNALDGSTADTTKQQNMAKFFTPSATPTTYTLTYKAYAWDLPQSASGTVGTSLFLGGPEGQRRVGWRFSVTDHTLKFVVKIADTGGSSEQVFALGPDVVNKILNCTIVVDQVNHLTWGSVDYGTGTYVATPYGGANLDTNIQSIAILQDPNGGGLTQLGLDIDDINVVPEPGALLALATGLVGLAGFAVRRPKK